MTLKELSAQYEASAQLLRGRLRELRILYAKTDDPDERWHIKRRIAELTPMLTQMNELSWLLKHYYTVGGVTTMIDMDSTESESAERKKYLQKVLGRIVQNELTELQRQMFLEYHIKRMTIPQIAAARGSCAYQGVPVLGNGALPCHREPGHQGSHYQRAVSADR